MKKLLNLIFVLLTTISFSQIPNQEWVTVINENTSTNDVFQNFSEISKFPAVLNNSLTNIAVTNSSDNKATVTSLNTIDGSISFSLTESINTIAKDLDFDQNSNLYTISSTVNTCGACVNNGIFKKINTSGQVIFSNIINNSNTQSNLNTIHNFDNKNFIYTRHRNSNNHSHRIYSFDSLGNQIFSNLSPGLDAYYGYDGRMILDNYGNIISFSKRQSSSNPNTYNVVVRKLNQNGQLLWELVYDFNSKMDMVALSNSITTDSLGDVYFINLNSSNWSNINRRLIKVNGQTGGIIFDQYLDQISSNQANSILINGNQVIVSNPYQVNSYNSTNGSLIWTQNFTNTMTVSKDLNGRLFLTASNSVLLIDTSGVTTPFSVTLPNSQNSTINHLFTIAVNNGDIYVIGNKITSNISKVFVAKFSGCQLDVNAGQDQTICEGSSVTLSAVSNSNANLSWSNGVINNISFVIDSTQTFTVTSQLGQCSKSDNITINVIQTDSINAGSDLEVCEGDTITLTATGSLNYFWSNDIQNGVSFVPVQPIVGITNVYVVQVSQFGCSVYDTVLVTVHDKPLVSAGVDYTTCVGSPVILNGSGFCDGGSIYYEWTGGIEDNQVFYPTSTQTYVVTGYSAFGCSNSDSVTVFVSQPSQSYISETFCDSFTLNSITYTESGSYTQILTNSTGCDSTIILKIDIKHGPEQPIVTVVDNLLTTQYQSGVDLQWFDCSTNSEINGENSLTYLSDGVGTWSVIASNQCGSQQSDCVTLDISSIGESNIEISIYPNPTQDFINVIGFTNDTNYNLYDMNGKLLNSGSLVVNSKIDLTLLSSGNYNLNINGKIYKILKL